MQRTCKSSVESLRVAFPAACGVRRSRSEPDVLRTGYGEVPRFLQYPAPWGGVVYQADDAATKNTPEPEGTAERYVAAPEPDDAVHVHPPAGAGVEDAMLRP